MVLAGATTRRATTAVMAAKGGIDMMRSHYEKLSEAIKKGRTREFAQTFQELRRHRPVVPQAGIATVKLSSVYDSAEDCLEIFHTVDLCRTEVSVALIARALHGPDGETLLGANAELLELGKDNKRVCGVSVVRHLARMYDGRCVTVALCALIADPHGNVSLLDAEDRISIHACPTRS
jgi:hypothetical protein